MCLIKKRRHDKKERERETQYESNLLLVGELHDRSYTQSTDTYTYTYKNKIAA